MRIWRLDIGLSRKARTKKIAWQWGISLDRGSCGCWMLSVGPIYLTWMSAGDSGCYTHAIVHLKKRAKKRGKK